jgi:hypothetical protein
MTLQKYDKLPIQPFIHSWRKASLALSFICHSRNFFVRIPIGIDLPIPIFASALLLLQHSTIQYVDNKYIQ